MLSITYATENDIPYLCSFEAEPLSEAECASKINDKKCYIIRYGDKVIGLMRYNMFWDCIPFLTQIYLDESYRKQGFGAISLKHWEDEMRVLGHKLVMLSTRIDIESHHFYRKFGYYDMGSIAMDRTPYKQALEIFMGKNL